MDKLSNDIKEYAMEFATGKDKGSIALATRLDPNVLIMRIKEINPSFSLLNLLSKELDQEMEMKRIRESISYKFYKALGGNSAVLNLYPSLVTRTTKGGTLLSNIIQVEMDIYIEDIENLFGNELVKDPSSDYKYLIGTGKDSLISNRSQFLNDLAFIKSYEGCASTNDITEINL